MAKKLGITLNEALALRAEIRHHTTLEQSMLVLLEDVGRWAIDKGMVKEKELPNYLEYIHYSSLQSINNKLALNSTLIKLS